MTDTKTTRWDLVDNAIERAYGAFYDGYHKIYIVTDKDALDAGGWPSRGGVIDDTDYPGAIPDMEEKVRQWYEDSGELRFIDEVNGDPDDIASYIPLIGQGENGDDVIDLDEYL